MKIHWVVGPTTGTCQGHYSFYEDRSTELMEAIKQDLPPDDFLKHVYSQFDPEKEVARLIEIGSNYGVPVKVLQIFRVIDDDVQT